MNAPTVGRHRPALGRRHDRLPGRAGAVRGRPLPLGRPGGRRLGSRAARSRCRRDLPSRRLRVRADARASSPTTCRSSCGRPPGGHRRRSRCSSPRSPTRSTATSGSSPAARAAWRRPPEREFALDPADRWLAAPSRGGRIVLRPASRRARGLARVDAAPDPEPAAVVRLVGDRVAGAVRLRPVRRRLAGGARAARSTCSPTTTCTPTACDLLDGYRSDHGHASRVLHARDARRPRAAGCVMAAASCTWAATASTGSRASTPTGRTWPRCAAASTAPAPGRRARASCGTRPPASRAGSGGTAAATPTGWCGVGFASQCDTTDRAPGYRRTAAELRRPSTPGSSRASTTEMIGEHGLYLGGAAGYEIDRHDPAFGSPAEAVVLATSAGLHPPAYLLVVEDLRSRSRRSPARRRIACGPI